MTTETKEKERSVLILGEDVRAILDGRKTQFRRVVKLTDDEFERCRLVPQNSELVWRFDNPSGSEIEWKDVSCPFGSVGDRLWVRETFKIVAWPGMDNDRTDVTVKYLADGAEISRETPNDNGETLEKIMWQCSDDCESAGVPLTGDDYYDLDEWEKEIPTRTRPSTNMPRWASRITLEVVSVHVERLRDILFWVAEARRIEN